MGNQSVEKIPAFEFLYNGLREAKHLFNIDNKHAGRQGAIHALEITLKFFSMNEVIYKEGLNAPLNKLFSAVMSLDDGVIDPILQKEKIDHRGKSSTLYETMKGVAAFTARRLAKTGMKTSDAHKKVAEVLNVVGAKPARGGKPISKRTVKDWCADVSEDVGCHGEAAKIYRLLDTQYPLTAVNKDLSVHKVRSAYCELLKNAILESRSHEAT